RAERAARAVVRVEHRRGEPGPAARNRWRGSLLLSHGPLPYRGAARRRIRWPAPALAAAPPRVRDAVAIITFFADARHTHQQNERATPLSSRDRRTVRPAPGTCPVPRRAATPGSASTLVRTPSAARAPGRRRSPWPRARRGPGPAGHGRRACRGG